MSPNMVAVAITARIPGSVIIDIEYVDILTGEILSI